MTDLIIISIYLCLLISMGFIFGRINRNTSDYFRGGQRGTWWLVGISMLMALVSARTFTGNAAIGYEAGLTFLTIYLVQIMALPVELYIGPRFRRLRVTTNVEVVRQRYGAATEQFIAYLRMITSLFVSASFLWGLAIFVSGALNVNLQGLIIVLGLVVMLYATIGGSWAVMGNDFVQGLVMLSMCILLAFLALKHVGGIGALLEQIASKGFNERFSFINKPGVFEEFGRNYGWSWTLATCVSGLLWNMSMGNSEKYFAVKDERNARGLACLVAGAVSILMFLVLVPVLVGRLYFADLVAADPSGTDMAYTIVSKQLLPGPLMSMMVVAMFAASVSSLDTGMNRNAGVFVKNVLPPLCRRLGLKPPQDKKELVISKYVSFIFGCLIILIALYLSNIEGKGMFEILMDINAILTPPIVIPMVLGLYLKKTPKYAAIISIAVGAVAGLYALSLEGTDQAMAWFDKTWLITGLTSAAYLMTLPFYKMNSPQYNQMVDEFFRKMNTPVDFEKEVGQGNEDFQMKLLGSFACIVGTFILLLMLVPGNDAFSRKCIAAVASMIYLVGVPLLLFGLHVSRKKKANNPR